MPRDLRLAALTILMLTGLLLASGCGWLWPRDNPRDPVRCDPTCPEGLVCGARGICVLPDGGLPRDGGGDE